MGAERCRGCVPLLPCPVGVTSTYRASLYSIAAESQVLTGSPTLGGTSSPLRAYSAVSRWGYASNPPFRGTHDARLTVLCSSNVP
jgi:hypothetical protein